MYISTFSANASSALHSSRMAVIKALFFFVASLAICGLILWISPYLFVSQPPDAVTAMPTKSGLRLSLTLSNDINSNSLNEKRPSE